ncbi:hypothetical protein ZWY2020_015815 [Hordeum vulgare]|nr:hypothetical protein ZWY2020_015815 [Hordeum vulgare]
MAGSLRAGRRGSMAGDRREMRAEAEEGASGDCHGRDVWVMAASGGAVSAAGPSDGEVAKGDHDLRWAGHGHETRHRAGPAEATGDGPATPGATGEGVGRVG